MSKSPFGESKHPRIKHVPKKRLETRDLWKELASRTAMPEDIVKSVLTAFVDIVKESMQNDTRVVVRHFGSFLAKQVIHGVAIRFKPANEFTQEVRKAFQPMEKYAVKLNNEAVLLAKITKECPSCKSKLEQLDPPSCPSCGTAPFEEVQK